MYSLLALSLFAAAEPAGFTAVGSEGKRVVGKLVRLDPDGSAVLATQGGDIPVRELLSLQRVGVPRPALPRGAQLLTTTGDRIPGSVRNADGRTLSFRPTLLNLNWPVPLSAVSVVWLSRPPVDTPVDPARYSWYPEAKRGDVLYFRNGDLANGTLTSIDADVHLKPDRGAERVFDLSEPLAIALDPSLARKRKPTSPYSHLVLGDGTRLELTSTSCDGTTFTGKTLFGLAVAVPVEELVSLDVYQGRVVYLSDLKPSRVVKASFLSVDWPWTADRTVHGAELRLKTPAGVETFDKGLGTHPKTAITFSLDGKYRCFEARVGLDAASGRGGSAKVRIEFDGKDVTPPDLQAALGMQSVPVLLDVTKTRELTLVVDYGPGGDVRADVNWGGARVVE